ncbi:MAG: methyl-accepting chemotaxis protein [Candidatus Omnitrophica bacterium]|jgi:methyl-accepting chemotaxis protein|nr:methyl-accepting chemotaxis protein [Candidatus Omnitrophota bacterium]
MKGRGVRRRSFFVDPGLQLRYMAAIILCMLLASFLTGVLVYFGVWGGAVSELSEWKIAGKLAAASRLKDYDGQKFGIPAESMPNFHLKEARMLSADGQNAVLYVLNDTNGQLMTVALIMAAVIGAASIFLSHRIAGPVSRIEKSVNAMTGGNLTSSFRLRKGDELKGLSVKLDDMAEIFRRKIEVSVNSLDEIIKDADKLSPSQVKAKADEARRQLLYFKTKP